jgi:pSer/pThr/pTyr-binding forkhead associated (FHA) protein
MSKSRIARLVAATDEARAALGNKAYVRITTFPFKIGRESRSQNPIARVVTTIERRLDTVPQLNDLYLIEPSSAALITQISRKHCAIERVKGRFFLVDRESACGSTVVEARASERRTTVATTQTGGASPNPRSELREGDLIVIGNIDSPYVFRFQLEAHPI